MLREASETILKGQVLERAVLYARVSTDDTKKEGRNLEGQIKDGKEYAAQKGYKVIAEFAEDDRGASGADWDLPQMKKVLDMAERGEFDVFIVRELDRLARSLGKQLHIEEKLKSLGIKVEYSLVEFAESPEGRAHKNVLGVFSEYEREKIAERTMRGRWNTVKSGQVVIHNKYAPYGYRKAIELPNGEVEIVTSYVRTEFVGRNVIVIDENEAEIVRLIFDKYINGGKSQRALAGYLNKLEIAAPKSTSRKSSAKWRGYTIGMILENEIYCGIWRYKGGYTVDVPEIISRAVWQAAQDKKEDNKRKSKRNRKRDYFLVGHIVCGKCNRRMQGKTNILRKDGKIVRETGYYICDGTVKKARNVKKRCDMRYFRQDQVDPAIWQWIEETFTDEKKLEDSQAAFEAEMKDQIDPLKKELDFTQGLIKQQEESWKSEMVNLRIVTSEKAKEAIAQEIANIEKTLKELKERAEVIKAQIEVKTLTPEQKMFFREFSQMMKDDIETVKGDYESIRMLFNRLNLECFFYTDENGKRKVKAVSKLGSETVSFDKDCSKMP